VGATMPAGDDDLKPVLKLEYTLNHKHLKNFFKENFCLHEDM
jgi:hypothetical protein